MPFYELHAAVKKDDLARVSSLLNHQKKLFQAQVNAYDCSGCTPLMHAVSNPKISVAMMQLLLEHGASTQQNNRQPFALDSSVLALALQGGDPHKVKVLLEAGADIHYTREGYNALIDAVQGRDVMRDEHLLELLTLLIDKRVALNSVTGYAESGLRVLSRLGRFDAVRLLLNAGADAGHLQWTPLMHAVALGSLSDVQAQCEGAALEETDWWQRTAWLLAIQSGEIPKAQFLLKRGASRDATGRCGKPALFYAIESHHSPMLCWLLEIGMDVEQTDQFGATPLMTAVDRENLQALDILLRAGAEVNREKERQTALSVARERGVAMRLLDAGADPRQLSTKGQRTLLGFAPDADEDALGVVTPREFLAACSRRFGTRNPEKFTAPFWLGMIRAGINAYQATQLFRGAAFAESADPPRKRLFEEAHLPVWCAQRFGQSITFLSDGRIVQIGGEHEDGYDPDFCIYNDVFVHDVASGISIFGYPEAVFPPTDFHTATLIGEYIYVIGLLGYPAKRSYGTTSVYRLDTRNFSMELVETSGTPPGWIYRHRAVLVSAHEIRISGGTVAAKEHEDAANEKFYLLDTKNRVWRAE